MKNTILSPADFKDESKSWRQAITALVEKGWVVENSEPPRLSIGEGLVNEGLPMTQVLELNLEQKSAVESMLQRLDDNNFSCTLLHGVTGSGKTEVYFSTMQTVLDQNKQVLFLVPEIGLTPQLIKRIQDRFSVPLVTLHSGMNDKQRHLAWWHAKQGEASIVLGTRSAVFTSFKDLGLIVVDEEHDVSFKQQDKVRYQARDVAIYRAKQAGVPIILGSATPSLESFVNADSGRYHSLRLVKRATNVALPTVELFDMKVLPSNDGLSPAMVAAVKSTLENSKQVILFLNRRGFAPVMYCKECSATTDCHRCDSHLTYHQRINRLRCHHCGYESVAKNHCLSCNAKDSLVGVGEGTQRVEESLKQIFPAARVLRIDRDSTRRKGELEELLEQARRGDADILLGTQLLTKGHDFPEVDMVGILGADQGLYSSDFRAAESLFQQILQVAGRAGRRSTVGRVFIQTVFPEHPFYERVINHDFDGFAQELMHERHRASYPPFAFFALIRAESPHQAKALQFLRLAKSQLQGRDARDGVTVMDAVPAPMEQRAGKYRAQLLISAKQRSPLNACLSSWLSQIKDNEAVRKLSSSVRWSVDVDPVDLF
jgi:primosomal protein N' (replication factor Y)